MGKVIALDGLDEIVQALRNQGRTVFGPTVRNGVISNAAIEHAEELPTGWTEEQNGGTYRLAPTGTEEVFSFSSPSTSWKRFLYPERTLLITSKRQNGEVSVQQPQPDAPAMAFFGIRSCDLAALSILDQVFLDPNATDPTYEARRTDPFIVAVTCGNPGNTCFCASMDTGPSPSSGFDLAITELYDDDSHQFLVESGSERGLDLLDSLEGEDASNTDYQAATSVHEQAVASMGRQLDRNDPPRAAQNLDHPHWDDVAERCLACGNCTMVCPTCFCSTTEDITDLSGLESERWRVWESCFSLDFSYLHGGSVRTTVKSRYRQWLLHKLVTWEEQFGRSGCVGCGRCITWCPVGIDLTTEIAAIARDPNSQEHHHPTSEKEETR